MFMIEISEHKLDKATDYAEKMLKYGGMLMQCLSEWGEESGYGERGDEEYRRSMMGNRMGFGSRYGGMNLREDEWEDDEMSERRGGRRRRDSMGRYR